MAIPNTSITKTLTLAPDGKKYTKHPDGVLPGSAPGALTMGTPTKTSTSITGVVIDGNGSTSYQTRVDGGTPVAGLTISGLSASTQYSVEWRGQNEVDFGPWTTPGNVTTNEAGGLIFTENFEGALQSGSALVNGAEVVDSTKITGTKTCRVNLKVDAADPLIAFPKNSCTYEYNGTLLRDTSSDIVTAQWDFRYDDAKWDGTREAINDATGVILKAGYFGAYQNKVNGFYVVHKAGPNGSIQLGDNRGRGDDGWEDSTWANDPGRLIWWMNTGQDFGTGTGVHKFRVTVDHSHPDYQQWRMWVDGILATNATYAADGIIRLPKTWTFESFSTCYTNDDNVNLSSDRTETACGIEFDNIELFEGEPS